MQINNKLLFIFIEEASLQVRPKVIRPAESTTLAAAAEAGELGDGTPATLAVSENKIDQFFVLLGCPRPLLHAQLVTTRLPTHHFELSTSSSCYTNLNSDNAKSPTHPPIYRSDFTFFWVNHMLIPEVSAALTFFLCACGALPYDSLAIKA